MTKSLIIDFTTVVSRALARAGRHGPDEPKTEKTRVKTYVVGIMNMVEMFRI